VQDVGGDRCDGKYLWSLGMALGWVALVDWVAWGEDDVGVRARMHPWRGSAWRVGIEREARREDRGWWGSGAGDSRGDGELGQERAFVMVESGAT